ncbi:hypothetical protein ACOXVJ_15195 [Pseudomonas knackmussii]|uniref:hypothetical protein n=1 Tax=Pseudomonas knackmussii TaxID=65741 RepID=UPI003BD5974C
MKKRSSIDTFAPAPDDLEMKWLDVTREDLDVALASIKRGHDPESARNIIEYFHERMSNGFSYDQQFLQELMAYVFAGIAEGKTADQAFGLKLQRGKYERKDTTERDVAAAACMLLMSRKGVRYLDAKGDTANLLFPDGEGEKAIEHACREYHGELGCYTDVALLECLGAFADTPIIKRLMAG